MIEFFCIAILRICQNVIIEFQVVLIESDSFCSFQTQNSIIVLYNTVFFTIKEVTKKHYFVPLLSLV